MLSFCHILFSYDLINEKAFAKYIKILFGILFSYYLINEKAFAKYLKILLTNTLWRQFFTKKTSTLVLWKSNNQGGLPLAYIYISGYTDSKWGSLVWKGKWLVRADKANHSVWIHSVCGPWPVSGPGPLHGPLPVLLYSSSFNNKDLLVSGFSQFGLC